MFNKFFMEATRSDWIAVVAWAKPILRSVIALPGIVAGEGAAPKKHRRNSDGKMVFQGCTTMRHLTRIRYCISRFVRDDK
jgi:hypothetical protein